MDHVEGLDGWCRGYEGILWLGRVEGMNEKFGGYNNNNTLFWEVRVEVVDGE